MTSLGAGGALVSSPSEEPASSLSIVAKDSTQSAPSTVARPQAAAAGHSTYQQQHMAVATTAAAANSLSTPAPVGGTAAGYSPRTVVRPQSARPGSGIAQRGNEQLFYDERNDRDVRRRRPHTARRSRPSRAPAGPRSVVANQVRSMQQLPGGRRRHRPQSARPASSRALVKTPRGALVGSCSDKAAPAWRPGGHHVVSRRPMDLFLEKYIARRQYLDTVRKPLKVSRELDEEARNAIRLGLCSPMSKPPPCTTRGEAWHRLRDRKLQRLQLVKRRSEAQHRKYGGWNKTTKLDGYPYPYFRVEYEEDLDDLHYDRKLHYNRSYC